MAEVDRQVSALESKITGTNDDDVIIDSRAHDAALHLPGKSRKERLSDYFTIFAAGAALASDGASPPSDRRPL